MNTEKSDALDFTIRLLKEGEKIDAFDCGDDDLNDFILNSSVLYKEEMLAITYLVQTRTSGEVLAYFSLANTAFLSQILKTKRNSTDSANGVLSMKKD